MQNIVSGSEVAEATFSSQSEMESLCNSFGFDVTSEVEQRLEGNGEVMKEVA